MRPLGTTATTPRQSNVLPSEEAPTTPFDADGRLEVLANHEFFAGCTERQLAEIAILATERHLPAGAALCRQGEFANEVYVVVEGAAQVIVDGVVVGVTSPGEIVGELAMLGTGRRAASLLATSPMRVLAFSPNDIDLVLSADPSAARRLVRHDTFGASS